METVIPILFLLIFAAYLFFLLYNFHKKSKIKKIWKSATPQQKIILKVEIIASQLKKNKSFHFLNKNNATLFDTCLFIVYITIAKMCDNFDFEEKEKRICIDTIWHVYFKEIMHHFNANTDITMARINFYNRVRNNNKSSNNPSGINAVFEEYVNILSADISNGLLSDYKEDSPLCLIGLTESFNIKLEAKYSLTTALNSFDDEIENIIQLCRYNRKQMNFSNKELHLS